MKKRVANLLTGLLVNGYMAFTVLAILFEKRKRKKTTKRHVSELHHASVSKG